MGVGASPPEADEYDNMKWKKNQFGGRKVVGQATVLVHGHEKWAGDCSPCLIRSAANVCGDCGL